MKHLVRRTIGLGSLVLVCFWTFLGIHAALGQNSDRVTKMLILPPTLHAGQDMAFLRAGIVQMLASRLTLAGKVSAITPIAVDAPIPGDNAAAAALGRQNDADYVVLESVTILGDSVSTDARVLESSTGRTALTFSRAGTSQADIIAHVDQLADQIKTRLLGISAPVTSGPAVPPAGPAPKGPSSDIYQHPEKLLTSTPEGLMGAYDDANTQVAVRLLARGRRMDMQIRGVTAGDVDGDGALEIVCIDSTTIEVFRFLQGRMVKMAQVDAGIANVGVDVADLNGNGRDEIFITHFDNNDSRLLSYVMEWDGKQLQRIADELRWYFRAVDMSDRGRVLVGQRQGFEDHFGPAVYEIQSVDGTYDGAQKLTLPRNQTLFGFAQGAVRSAGVSDMVNYSRSGYLRVMDFKGNEEWSSVESYGGTENALSIASKDDPNERDILYLPSRVHLVDLDNDGLKEIVTVRNEDIAGVFSRTRMFKQGRLEILKWDQLGLVPVWRSRNVAKYIGDFTVADVDGNGKPEIIAAIVQKNRNVLGTGSSYLAVFSLDNLENKGK